MYTTDTEKGWMTWDGNPPHRSTIAAYKRVSDQSISWIGDKKRVRVAKLLSGIPIATIRANLPFKRYAVRIEGFEFWHHNRVLGHELFDTVIGFDSYKEAEAFIVNILSTTGATFA